MVFGMAMDRFTVTGLSAIGEVRQNLRLLLPGVIASLILVLRSTVIIHPINKKVFLSGVLKINSVIAYTICLSSHSSLPPYWLRLKNHFASEYNKRTST